MQAFRYIADVHNEFNPGDHNPVPHLDGESDMILIIGGDLGVVEKEYTYLPLLSELAERHQQVIYLPGNHEHYKGSLMRTDDKVRDAINREGLENVTYTGIQGDVIKLDGVDVIAHPLYCDMFGMDPIVVMEVMSVMNDFRMIRTGPSGTPYQRKLDAKDYVSLHQQAKDMIFPAIQDAHERGNKVLVATHWGPSRQSIPKRFKGSNINGAYVSDLDDLIFEHQPEFWFHGHTHDSFDYHIGQTRVICNPHGYVGTSDHNDQFDPNLVVEL